MKRNKKPLLIGALAVLLVALVVGGTIAWMTAEDSKTNAFTVGTFGEPSVDPKPDDPETSGDEDEEESTDKNADGFLTETEWKDGQTFIPGDPVAKNPNVGVAKDSVGPYVFIYVKNNAVEDGQSVAQYGPYFTIEKQWAPVTDNNKNEGDCAQEDVTPTKSTGAGAPTTGTYVDGLFAYVKDSSTNTTPQILDVTNSSNPSAVYTGELFEAITLPDGNGEHIVASNADVTVYAFIYGSKSGVSDGEEGSATAAQKAAIQWAEKLAATE